MIDGRSAEKFDGEANRLPVENAQAEDAAMAKAGGKSVPFQGKKFALFLLLTVVLVALESRCWWYSCRATMKRKRELVEPALHV